MANKMLGVSEAALIDDDEDNMDDSYDSLVAKVGKEKPPVMETAETQKHRAEIENLYPHFTRRKIELNRLIPAPDEWNFFKRDKDTVQALKENIFVYGQLSPALVWQQEDGTYMILGGHTRYEAIKSLHEMMVEAGEDKEAERFAAIDCNVYAPDELDEVEARQLIISDNTIRRNNDKQTLAKSVINMARLEKDMRGKRSGKWGEKRERINNRVGRLVGISSIQVARIKNMENLIDDFWSCIDGKDDAPQLSVSSASNLAKLSPELQQYIYDNALFVNRPISGSMGTKLAKAGSIEEVKDILDAPQTHTLRASEQFHEEIPNGYKAIAVACLPQEEEVLRQILYDAIKNRDDISQVTKDLLKELVG